MGATTLVDALLSYGVVGMVAALFLLYQLEPSSPGAHNTAPTLTPEQREEWVQFDADYAAIGAIEPVFIDDEEPPTLPELRWRPTL